MDVAWSRKLSHLTTEEPNGLVFLPPVSTLRLLDAGMEGGGELHKLMPVCRSTGMSLVSSGFSVICVGTGPHSALPKLEYILRKGWSHYPHLGRGQSLVSFFIKLSFVTFIEQNDNMSNCLHSVFSQGETFCLPWECVIYLSTPLHNRFTTITTNAMFWRKFLLYHAVTSLTLAAIGLSPRSTKAYITRDGIMSLETSLVSVSATGGLGPPLAHFHLPRVWHIVGVVVINAINHYFYLSTSWVL